MAGLSQYFCPTNQTFVPSEILLANLTQATLFENPETLEDALFMKDLAIGFFFMCGSIVGWSIFVCSIPASISALKSLRLLFHLTLLMKKSCLEEKDKNFLKKVKKNAF